LDGRKLKVSNQVVIEPGHKMRFAGEGMPKRGKSIAPGSKGDLIIEVAIQFPRVGQKLSDNEKSAITHALSSLQ
jgi:DnaJ-class molecular chaperone